MILIKKRAPAVGTLGGAAKPITSLNCNISLNNNQAKSILLGLFEPYNRNKEA